MGDFFTNLFTGNAGSGGIDLASFGDSVSNLSPELLNSLDFSGVDAGALGADSGFMAGLGNATNFLGNVGGNALDFAGSQGGSNIFNMGLQGLGAANQFNLQNEALKIAKASEARSADAFQRDKEADERRQALTF